MTDYTISARDIEGFSDLPSYISAKGYYQVNETSNGTIYYFRPVNQNATLAKYPEGRWDVVEGQLYIQ